MNNSCIICERLREQAKKRKTGEYICYHHQCPTVLEDLEPMTGGKITLRGKGN